MNISSISQELKSQFSPHFVVGYEYNKDVFFQDEYTQDWKEIAENEIGILTERFKKYDWFRGIEHIGSTSVPGMTAKPAIDLMLGVEDISEEHASLRKARDQIITNELKAAGYQVGDKIYLYRVRGTVPICIFSAATNSPRWKSRIAFREMLKANPEYREKYSQLKELLIEKGFDQKKYVTMKSIYISIMFLRNGWTVEELVNGHVIDQRDLPALLKSLESAGTDESTLRKIKGETEKYPIPSPNQKFDVLVDKPQNTSLEEFAKKTIDLITSFIPKELIVDAMHVGSTSINGIKNRPCMAINIAVTSVEKCREFVNAILEKTKGQLAHSSQKGFTLWLPGSLIDGKNYQYFIHFMHITNRQWIMRRDFRNYLRTHPEEAREYERIKIKAAEKQTRKHFRYYDAFQRLPTRQKENLIGKYCRYVSRLEHEYSKEKAPFVLSILHKCGHENLYLNPDHDHSIWDGDGCICGEPKGD
jgi:GrpB-like predicted nucleotidyltransferase (UPF0157 family)